MLLLLHNRPFPSLVSPHSVVFPANLVKVVKIFYSGPVPIVQRSIYKNKNGGRVLSGHFCTKFRDFWYKFTFMIRIFRRYVNKTGRALYLCRCEHSSPVRTSLKCEETQFNGVEVNLSQLEGNLSLDDFSTRLKGKFIS